MDSIVALRKESVDRNQNVSSGMPKCQPVALRKESVDRNPSWRCDANAACVALRKESVDRNSGVRQQKKEKSRRSPQGERG